MEGVEYDSKNMLYDDGRILIASNPEFGTDVDICIRDAHYFISDTDFKRWSESNNLQIYSELKDNGPLFLAAMGNSKLRVNNIRLACKKVMDDLDL